MTTSPPKIKAVGLLSGGLDSALAVKIILERGVAVIGYYLRTPFAGGGSRAERLAELLGIELVVDEAGEDYVEMLKAPRFGRGAAFNPCVDCHIFMLRRAGALMLERGASFCFTGEVLGQRPMSQRRHQLELIEREAGLEGKLLRPLSAKLLPPTEAEEEGLVDRAALLGLEGRSRKTQLALAAAYGITGYGSPAGGCLLTDKNFGARLSDAFAHGEDRPTDIALLKTGRHFRLPSGAKAVVGRDQGENEILLRYLEGDATAFEVEGAGSPTTLLRPARREDWPRAAALTLRYSDARDRAEASTLVRTAGGKAETVTARAGDAADAESWRVGGGPGGK